MDQSGGWIRAEGGWGKLYFLYFSEFIYLIEFILNPVSLFFHVMQIMGAQDAD